MKYTERFFRFPVRIYDRYSSQKAEEQEKDLDTPMEGEWVEGYQNMPHTDISDWCDYFDSTQGVEDVKENGFMYTLVFSRKAGAYVCTLPSKEFARRLDAFVDKYEKWVKEETEKIIAANRATISVGNGATISDNKELQ